MADVTTGVPGAPAGAAERWRDQGDGTVARVVSLGSGTGTNVVNVKGKYNSTPPALTDGNTSDLQLDSKASLKVIQSDPNGVVVDITQPVKTFQSNSFSNLTANGTTTVKSGAGTLDRIVINTKGASANTCTVYDNTAGSGTKIATLDTTLGQNSLSYGLAFTTGLTIVLATGTSADITVVYR